FSGSMMPKLKKLAAASQTALSVLRPGDRAAVMIFGGRSTVVQPFTEDMDQVAAGVDAAIADKGAALGRSRGTRLVAAINAASAYIRAQTRTERRRAVMIVTDNIGMVSGRKHTAIKNLWEAD